MNEEPLGLIISREDKQATSFKTVVDIHKLYSLVRKYGLRFLLKYVLVSIFLFPRQFELVDYYDLDAYLNPKSTSFALYNRFLEMHKKYPVLIDVGCGFGENADRIQHCATVVGVEISKHCAQEIKMHANAVMADAQYLPFRKCVADVVIASEVLEHLKDPLKCMVDVHNALKENGRFCISITNPDAYKIRRLTNLPDILKLTHVRYRRQHIHDFSLPNLTSLLNRLRFEINEIDKIEAEWKIFGILKKKSVFHWLVISCKQKSTPSEGDLNQSAEEARLII